MWHFNGEDLTVKWYKVLHNANGCEAVIEKTEQLYTPHSPYTSTARTVVLCNEALCPSESDGW